MVKLLKQARQIQPLELLKTLELAQTLQMVNYFKASSTIFKSTTEPSHPKKYCKISMLQDLDMEYKTIYIP